MALKYLTYCTIEKLSCAYAADKTIFIAVQSIGLLADGAVCPVIKGEICQVYSTCDSCTTTRWTYTLSYDDEQLADPSTPLVAGDVTGVWCEDAFVEWIECISGGVAAAVCVEDSTTIDFFLTDDQCVTGDVKISQDEGNEIEARDDGIYAPTGGDSFITSVLDTDSIDLTVASGVLSADSNISLTAGNQITINPDGLYVPPAGSGGTGWLLLGNSGTVDGTNFLGTLDNIPFSIRVNNERAFRFEYSGTANLPNIIGGAVTNAVTTSFASFIGGGGPNVNYLTGPNVITDGNFTTIVGGSKNTITNDSAGDVTLGSGHSFIGGGIDNSITVMHWPFFFYEPGGNVITGGIDNVILNSDMSVIGGGIEHFIQYDAATNIGGPTPDVIAGGNINLIFGFPFTYTGVSPGTISGSILGNNFIGGGETNEIDNGLNCTISGGHDNNVATTISGIATYLSFGDTVSGGLLNTLIAAQRSFIGGCVGNNIRGDDSSSIIGGFFNFIRATTPADSLYAFRDQYGFSKPVGNVNTIVGGVGNYIEDGYGTTIAGGGFLQLGAYSFGYQSVATRNLTAVTGQNVFINPPFVATYSDPPLILPQVNLSAFPSIAYFGDVDLWIGNTNSTARKLKLFEPNSDLDFSSTNYSSFQAQTQTANIEYILPASIPTVGQVLTVQAVAGSVVTLEWA